MVLSAKHSTAKPKYKLTSLFMMAMILSVALPTQSLTIGNHPPEMTLFQMSEAAKTDFLIFNEF